MLSKLTVGFKDLLSSANEPVKPRPNGEFVMGINFGGEAVTIEGYPWQSYEQALANGLSAPGATALTTDVLPIPHVAPAVRKMLNGVIYKPQTLDLYQSLPNGSYDLYLWILENYQTHWHSLDVRIADQLIAQGIGHLTVNHWERYGPYRVTVTDGSLPISITTNDPKIDAHVMGLSLFKP